MTTLKLVVWAIVISVHCIFSSVRDCRGALVDHRFKYHYPIVFRFSIHLFLFSFLETDPMIESYELIFISSHPVFAFEHISTKIKLASSDFFIFR